MAGTFKLDRPWDEVKEKLKEAKMELTDEDLAYKEGDEDALLGRLEKKLGKSRDELKTWIESVSSNKAQAG
ncbi:MAG: general stress protein CsbD [Chitinophagaceae bacterium]|nr:MAG: general stress protein CsbD [Chitinophagaceae bacterium]